MAKKTNDLTTVHVLPARRQLASSIRVFVDNLEKLIASFDAIDFRAMDSAATRIKQATWMHDDDPEIEMHLRRLDEIHLLLSAVSIAAENCRAFGTGLPEVVTALVEAAGHLERT